MTTRYHRMTTRLAEGERLNKEWIENVERGAAMKWLEDEVNGMLLALSRIRSVAALAGSQELLDEARYASDHAVKVAECWLREVETFD